MQWRLWVCCSADAGTVSGAEFRSIFNTQRGTRTMKSTAKTLALGAALLCLLAGGMALPASAAVPLTGTAV